MRLRNDVRQTRLCTQFTKLLFCPEWLLSEKIAGFGRRHVGRSYCTGISISKEVAPISRCINCATELSRYQQSRTFSAPTCGTATISALGLSQVRESVEKKTRNWFQIPVGQWTRRDVAMARHLVEEYLAKLEDTEIPTRASNREKSGFSNYINEKHIDMCTRILRRWLLEHLSRNPETSHRSADLLQQLHRVLSTLRLYPFPKSKEDAKVAREKVVGLLRRFRRASDQLQDMQLRPRDKAYSMTMRVLTSFAHIPGTCNVARSLLDERLQDSMVPPPDILLWNACLHLMAKCSPFDKGAALQTQELFNSMTLPPDSVTYAAVLHAWARTCDGRQSEAAHRAQQHLNDMIEKGIATEICFSLCMDAWASAAKPEESEALFWKMHHLGLQPDDHAYLATLRAWGKCQDVQLAVERALVVFKHWERSRETRPTSTQTFDDTTALYTAVSHNWARQSNAGPAVERFLMVMEERASQRGGIGRPSRITYASAIRAWGNTDSDDAPERAEALFRQMAELSQGESQRDLAPCAITYTTLIRVWAQSRSPNSAQQAMRILREMEDTAKEHGRANSKPDTVAFNTVLHAFAKQGLADEAHDLLEEMKQKHTKEPEAGVPPDKISYATVIHAYVISKKPYAGGMARLLLQEMEDLARDDPLMSPTADTYRSVILAHKRKRGQNDGSMSEAGEAVFWRMVERWESKKSKAAPTVATCNALLAVWGASGDANAPKRAQAIITWMKRESPRRLGYQINPDETSTKLFAQIVS